MLSNCVPLGVIKTYTPVQMREITLGLTLNFHFMFTSKNIFIFFPWKTRVPHIMILMGVFWKRCTIECV